MSSSSSGFKYLGDSLYFVFEVASRNLGDTCVYFLSSLKESRVFEVVLCISVTPCVLYLK